MRKTPRKYSVKTPSNMGFYTPKKMFNTLAGLVTREGVSGQRPGHRTIVSKESLRRRRLNQEAGSVEKVVGSFIRRRGWHDLGRRNFWCVSIGFFWGKFPRSVCPLLFQHTERINPARSGWVSCRKIIECFGEAEKEAGFW
jgi:hypothetical protein